MHTLNGKIFLNEKTSSLIWTKGAEMHTQFQAFSKKFFEKIYPFTYSHWEQPNAHPESQKIFTPSLIWNWSVKTQPVFQKKGKKFARQHRQAFTSVKNKQLLLKYSRFCDMIFLDYCRRCNWWLLNMISSFTY